MPAHPLPPMNGLYRNPPGGRARPVRLPPPTRPGLNCADLPHSHAGPAAARTPTARSSSSHWAPRRSATVRIQLLFTLGPAPQCDGTHTVLVRTGPRASVRRYAAATPGRARIGGGTLAHAYRSSPPPRPCWRPAHPSVGWSAAAAPHARVPCWPAFRGSAGHVLRMVLQPLTPGHHEIRRLGLSASRAHCLPSRQPSHRSVHAAAAPSRQACCVRPLRGGPARLGAHR
jgi:hypothetical protein